VLAGAITALLLATAWALQPRPQPSAPVLAP
jgi:hypothetical protein